mgnify:CR=1 FL=1
MLDHCFESVPGWFGHQEAARIAVQNLPQNATVVEVGVWCGRSTAFLAVELLNSNRQFELYAVDTWDDSGDVWQMAMRQQFGVIEGSLRSVFDEQMRRVGLTRVFHPIQLDSVSASRGFADESLDLIIIDASHSYGDVCDDIRAWWPKLKWGGFMLFDDYCQPPWVEVALAVHDFMPQSELQVIGPAALYAKSVPERGRWQSAFEPPGEWMGFIPYVARPDLLARATQSVTAHRDRFCIIDQSDSGLTDVFCDGFAKFRWSGPRSFTAMQNLVQREALARNMKWLLFMHSDAVASAKAVDTLIQHARALDAPGTRWGCIFTNYDALACLNVRAIQDTGAWDESFLWYVSDIGYYNRMKWRGWRHLHCPSIHVEHLVSQTVAALDAEERAAVFRNTEWAERHYRHKWGQSWGHGTEPRYRIPYNGNP